MNPEQQLIWNYLNTEALGYENRKSTEEIRQELQLASGGPTNEHVRDLVRDMVFNHGSCIGSLMWQNGYWIIQNEEELLRVTRSLENRANSIRERAEILRTNWSNRNG